MDMKFQIFDGKTFEDLCKDIVTNQNHTKDQIETLVSDLRPLIKTTNDAMMVVPLIKQYLDASIHNDDHLVKLAAIIQRLVSSKVEADGPQGSTWLTDEERNQLMKDVESSMKDIQKEQDEQSLTIKSIKKD